MTTKRVTRIENTITNLRGQMRVVEHILDRVATGKWTSEQGMDALAKAFERGDGNTFAVVASSRLFAEGVTTTRRTEKDKRRGFIAGPRTNPDLPTIEAEEYEWTLARLIEGDDHFNEEEPVAA